MAKYSGWRPSKGFSGSGGRGGSAGTSNFAAGVSHEAKKKSGSFAERAARKAGSATRKVGAAAGEAKSAVSSIGHSARKGWNEGRGKSAPKSFGEKAKSAASSVREKARGASSDWRDKARYAARKRGIDDLPARAASKVKRAAGNMRHAVSPGVRTAKGAAWAKYQSAKIARAGAGAGGAAKAMFRANGKMALAGVAAAGIAGAAAYGMKKMRGGSAGSSQTGPKGGRFVMGPSGKKRYVRQ
jgi:hypothetical protein